RTFARPTGNRKTASRRSLRNSIGRFDQAATCTFCFLCQPSRPSAPRPIADIRQWASTLEQYVYPTLGSLTCWLVWQWDCTLLHGCRDHQVLRKDLTFLHSGSSVRTSRLSEPAKKSTLCPARSAASLQVPTA